MTSITIDKDIKLSKTHFSSIEELQEALLLVQHEQFELSDAHKKILDEREREADNATDKGLTWEEVEASISRRHA
jgi:hypothetical protein